MQLIDHQTKAPSELLQSIRALVANDLTAVDELIHAELASSVPLTQDITQHIFKSKGKQLRPLLVILASHAFSGGKALKKIHY